jgi:Phospholipase_D-nuclease N-terminal
MIVADVSFIDIFWSMLEFFFLFIWILILFHVFGDLFRDHSLSGGAKTLWVLFLVFLPFVAVFVYLIARGTGWPSGPQPGSSGPRSSSTATFGPSPPLATPRLPSRSPRPRSCWTLAPLTSRSSTG